MLLCTPLSMRGGLKKKKKHISGPEINSGLTGLPPFNPSYFIFHSHA